MPPPDNNKSPIPPTVQTPSVQEPILLTSILLPASVEAPFYYKMVHISAYIFSANLNRVVFKLMPDSIEQLINYHKDIHFPKQLMYFINQSIYGTNGTRENLRSYMSYSIEHAIEYHNYLLLNQYVKYHKYILLKQHAEFVNAIEQFVYTTDITDLEGYEMDGGELVCRKAEEVKNIIVALIEGCVGCKS